MRQSSLSCFPIKVKREGLKDTAGLTKGLRNVTGEFSLSFLAYNIKRAVNILGGARLAAACGAK